MARAPPAHPHDASRSDEDRGDDSESSHPRQQSRNKRSSKSLQAPWKPHKRSRLSIGAPGPDGYQRASSSSGQPMTPQTPHGQSSTPADHQPRSYRQDYSPYPQDIMETEHQVYVQPLVQDWEPDGRRDPSRAIFTSMGSWCEPSSSNGYRQRSPPLPMPSSRRDGLLSPSPEPPSPTPGVLSHQFHFHHEGESDQDRINKTWYLEGRAKMDSQRMLTVPMMAAQTAY